MADLFTWADMDFDLIKTGMITGGGVDDQGDPLTAVSFADYLTVYLETVKARLIFFNGFIPNFIKNLSFEIGSIRNAKLLLPSGTPSPTNFPEAYWRLVQQVAIIPNSTYYDPDILFDAVNFSDYVLPALEDDEFSLRADIPQEIVDILIDSIGEQQPHYEIFTADILRAMYQILSIYTIASKDIPTNRNSKGGIIPLKDNTLTRDVRKFWSGFGGETIPGPINWSTANDDAYTEYENNGLDEGKYIDSKYNNPSFNLDYQLAYRSHSLAAEFFTNAEDSNSSYSSKEGYTIISTFKNNDDQFVEFNFSMYGILERNYVRLIKDLRFTDDTPSINKDVIEGAFYDQYPQIDPGQPTTNIDLTNNLSAGNLSAEGLSRSYNFSGNYPPSKMAKVTDIDSDGGKEGADAGDYRKVFQFWLQSPEFIFVDSNALTSDYFVEPDLWPLPEED